MEDAIEGLQNQTFNTIAEAADHHGIPRLSLSKHIHDLGLPTESVSYSHGRKFTDYEEKELVDRIIRGNHHGHKSFMEVANKWLKQLGKDYEVRKGWSQLLLDRHWESLHSRLHAGSMDYTESFSFLRNQAKEQRPPPPSLPKSTDAERWIAERFVDHAPEAVEDIDHFLGQVRGRDESSPEFLQECEK